VQVRVPWRFQQSLRVGAIGLVARHVGSHSVRREQDRTVTEDLELARPVGGRAAGFQNDGRRLAIGEDSRKRGPWDPMALGDGPWVTGDGDPEDRLGDVDGDGSRMHRAPPSGVMPAKATWHYDADPVAGGVHPITCSGQAQRGESATGQSPRAAAGAWDHDQLVAVHLPLNRYSLGGMLR
jgi:hypothetical protein